VLKCSERGMKHLPTARFAVRYSFVSDSQFALQKAQEQENQLRIQLKKKYMENVSSGHFSILLLPTNASTVARVPEAIAETGSREKEPFHQH